MKLLLDENVAAPLTSTVRTLLRRSHEVLHVIDVPGWSGTKDLRLYEQAAEAGSQESADGQRLVTLRAVDPGRDHRYTVRDPRTDPPKFWPHFSA